MSLWCHHFPKTHRMEFQAGDGSYTLELCSSCRKKENLRFLIKEEKIKLTEMEIYKQAFDCLEHVEQTTKRDLELLRQIRKNLKKYSRS